MNCFIHSFAIKIRIHFIQIMKNRNIKLSFIIADINYIFFYTFAKKNRIIIILK